MNTNFRWLTVALSAAAVLPVPVRAQAQVQSGNVRSGNGVNYVRAARSVPSRSFVAAPSFHPAPIRRPAFNAARIKTSTARNSLHQSEWEQGRRFSHYNALSRLILGIGSPLRGLERLT